ncbi:MAG: 50S ribosomal protein L18, partial [Actinomycetota bacterium]
MKTSAEARIRRHRSVRKKVSGSPERPRLAVFRSNRHLYAQLIDDVAQKTLAAASTLEPEFKDQGPAAAGKVGALVAQRAKEKGIKRVVFDRGGFRYQGQVKA